MQQVPKVIPALTGLRAVAVLMIFFYHYERQLTDLPSIVSILVRQGFLGVQFFFVLSGFVICWNYAPAADKGGRWIKGYLEKRFSRIAPLYLLLTGLTYLVIRENFTDPHQWIKELIINLTFLKGFSEELHLTGIGPAWSLTPEWCFYLSFPMLLSGMHKKWMGLKIVFTAWFIAFLLGLFSLYFPIKGWLGSWSFLFNDTFFGRILEFMLGMRLALVIPVQLGTKSERNQFLTNYTIAGLLIMLSAIFLLGLDRGSWPLALPQQGVYFVEANVLFPIGAYYFLYGLIIEQTFIRRALSHPFMVLLGKSSYAFFLVHTGIVAVFIQRQISRDLSLLLISLYGLSILIYFILERPLNQWFNRLFSSSTTHRRSMGQ